MQPIKLKYQVDAGDLSRAGEASSKMKMSLKKLGIPAESIRRAAICMYEGEINMVIHANGGLAEVVVTMDDITIRLADTGPGIPDLEKAMTEGWSTASNEVRNLGFGAGMGLPNMKRNADGFDIKSEVGVGTDITMTFNI